jgi:hypothetical protein
MSSECLARIPCPECGSSDARSVCWTSWGGFLGPFLFRLVRCLDCGNRYLSRTGQQEHQAAKSYLRILFPLTLWLTAAVIAAIALLQVRPQ